MTDNKSIEKLPEITNNQWETVNPKNRKLMEDFLKQSTNLSDQTLKQYESALRIFFWYIKENCEDKHLTEIRPRDFLGYQNYLVGRGISSSGVRLKRSAVSSLNSYIETYYSEDFPNWRSFINKKIVAPPQNFVHEKEPLNLEEYEKLCEELERRKMWQQLAYLRFSFTTGCRRGEVIQLKKEIVNYEKKIATIKVKDEDGNQVEKQVGYYMTHNVRCKGAGKIGKIRQLQFDEKAMEAIKKCIEFRGEDDCEFVFVSNINGKVSNISPTTFNLWCSTTFTEIVGRRVHPHLTRESRATTLVVEQNKDIKVAQKLLGHRSSVTTDIYVIRNDSEISDEAFE